MDAIVSRMAHFSIEAADRPLSPGDFNIAVHGNSAEVPRALVSALDEQGIGDLEELLSFAGAFPTALAQMLDWQPEDVAPASRRLSQQLGMPIDDMPPRQVYFGAEDPSALGGSDS